MTDKNSRRLSRPTHLWMPLTYVTHHHKSSRNFKIHFLKFFTLFCRWFIYLFKTVFSFVLPHIQPKLENFQSDGLHRLLNEKNEFKVMSLLFIFSLVTSISVAPI